MLGQNVDVTLGREPRRFTRLCSQIQHKRSPRRRRPQCSRQLRHQNVRDHTGEPRARPEHHEVGAHDGLHRLPGGRRIPGQQSHPAHLAHRGGDRHLTADHPAHPRIGLQTRHIGLDLQGDGAHRQHPALHPQNASEFVECRDRIGKHLTEARQYQVADRMTGQCAAATEPVLNDRRPQSAVRAVRSQGRQRHSQVTGWHHVEFAAEPSGRTAVVGNRHHGRHMWAEPPGRRQGGVQPVPSTEGHDPRRHSRPRSRCSTWTVSPSPPCNRSASASAIATLRCLPPVHPMATVI